MKKITLIMLIFLVGLTLMGASCGGGDVPPPIPPETEMRIYQTFYEVESKYKTVKEMVDAFGSLTAQTTNFACRNKIKDVCDAGHKYADFLDTTLRPASIRAGDAYQGAVKVWQDYRAGSASEASLMEKIAALQRLIDDLETLHGQGKNLAGV